MGGGTMRRDCMAPLSTLGAGPSARFTMSAISVTAIHRSNVAGPLRATKSVEASLIPASAGTSMDLVGFCHGTSIQGGARALFVRFRIAQAISVAIIARCIAATTKGISWNALLGLWHL